MGLLSFFSTGKIVEKGVDSIISAGDKLVYTEEEKADMKLKTREWHLELLNAMQPFKIAQRILAFGFFVLFALSFIFGLGITAFNTIYKFNKIKAGIKPEDIVYLDIQQLFDLVNAFDLGLIMGTIALFYFGGGTINSLKGK